MRARTATVGGAASALALVAACGSSGPCEVAWPSGAEGTAESLPNLDGDEATRDLLVRWPSAEPAGQVQRYRVMQGERLLAEVDGRAHEASVGVRLDGGFVRIEACDRSDRCTTPEASLRGIHLVVKLIAPPAGFTHPPPRLEAGVELPKPERVWVVP